MKCNYNRKQNNSVPRWVAKIENNTFIMKSLSEKDYIEQFFKEYGVKIVTPKEKLISALMNGDYIIGIDYNPFVLCDVFHYENGMFEFLKFANAGIDTPIPLRLFRDKSILFSASKYSHFEALVAGMSHYDDFIVCKKGYLLDIENIPPSIADDIIEKIKIKGKTV